MPRPSIQEISEVYDHYYTDTHLAALNAVFELGVEFGRSLPPPVILPVQQPSTEKLKDEVLDQ